MYSAAHSPVRLLIEDMACLLQKRIAIALRCGNSVTQEAAADIDRQAQEITVRFLEKIPDVRALLATDLQAFYDGDPATSLVKSSLPIRGCSPSQSTAWRTSCFCSKVPLIPRIMTDTRTAARGLIFIRRNHRQYFFIDYGTTSSSALNDHHRRFGEAAQGVTLGALSTPGRPAATAVTRLSATA